MATSCAEPARPARRPGLGRFGDTAGLVVLLLATAVALFPVYWMLSTAFKTQAATFQIPPSWLFTPTLANFRAILTSDTLHALGMSLIVATGTAALCVLLGSTGAYALARFPLHGKPHVSFWIISNRMLPPVVLAIPMFILSGWIHLYDNPIILILVYTSANVPIVVWIMTSFFQGLPREIEEAALLDGSTRWHAFHQVVLPQVLPGIAVSALFSFVFTWNGFLMPFVLTSANQTLPVLAATYSTGFARQWGSIAAISILLIIPPVIATIIGSRYLVRGLSLGAVQ